MVFFLLFHFEEKGFFFLSTEDGEPAKSHFFLDVVKEGGVYRKTEVKARVGLGLSKILGRSSCIWPHPSRIVSVLSGIRFFSFVLYCTTEH